MRKAGRILAGLAIAAAAIFAVAASPRPEDPKGLVLERIVVVGRHGVRSPTKAVDWLSKYSAERWPDWPVPPGELTASGARDIGLMGAWLRQDYAQRGLWAAKGCPGAGDVYGWSDGLDQRTRASGDALLAGAFPGCGLVARHGPEGVADPIFDGIGSSACPLDPEVAKAAVLARVKGDLEHPAARYDAEKSALRRLLDPVGARKRCGPDAGGACFLAQPNDLVVQKGGLKLAGPLALSSTLTESLLLEYAQGMPLDQVGWGRAGSPARLALVMDLHNIEADLMRRTPYLAGHNAARLAQAVVQAVEGRPGLPEQDGAGARLVLIAGHDTNLSNMAGVLGVDWALKDQPDKTPPGGILVFEVWRDVGTGAQYVRVRFIYQTLAQLREQAVLTAGRPPGQLTLTLPDCTEGPGETCPVARFADRIRAVVPRECWR